MANTQQKAPLTQKLQAQELGSQSETLTDSDNLAQLRDAFGRVGDGNSTPDFDQMREAFGQFGDSGLSDNLFRDALAKNGQQELGVQEAPAEQRAEMHARYQELTEQQKQVEIFAGKRLQDEQEVMQIQQQIVLMATQRKMPEPQRPEIAQVRVVDPGANQYPFTTLLNLAMRKIREYTEPQQIVAKRDAKRTGLNANAAVSKKQQMQLQHEFNVNGGA